MFSVVVASLQDDSQWPQPALYIPIPTVSQGWPMCCTEWDRSKVYGFSGRAVECPLSCLPGLHALGGASRTTVRVLCQGMCMKAREPAPACQPCEWANFGAILHPQSCLQITVAPLASHCNLRRSLEPELPTWASPESLCLHKQDR